MPSKISNSRAERIDKFIARARYNGLPDEQLVEVLTAVLILANPTHAVINQLKADLNDRLPRGSKI